MKITGYIVSNSIGLILLGGFSAIVAIHEKAGFNACRDSQFGIMSEGKFWEIPPMAWVFFSLACVVLAILSFKQAIPNSIRIVPFIPTTVVLLCIVLGMLRVVDFGTRFITCVSH